MKILLINKSDRTGGAAVAASRLMAALTQEGHKVRMLVCEKATGNAEVTSIGHRAWMQWCFLWERFCIWVANHFSRKNLFAIDIANIGYDITQLPEFQQADLIHLHWVNQGMLSLDNLHKIFKSGKPVVWTMHDMWPCTAICHYARTCEAYCKECCNCSYLIGGGSNHDLSHTTFKKKQKMYNEARVHFVACSHWLEGLARKSSLLKGQSITSIPNPIDTNIFCRKNQAECRERLGLPHDKKLLLFGAANITDKRKGLDYLISACNILASTHPELQEQIELMVLGSNADIVAKQLSFRVWPLGYVTDIQKTVDIYNAADAFVTPSLEDNLPNMIMESMACGLPCVGFEVGGVPEMIDHMATGYVACYKDENDLLQAIYHLLFEADKEAMTSKAIEKVQRCYSQQAVARQYIEVYEQAKNNIKG